MRIREDESGQMLVMTALSLTILLGFVALAVDVGMMFRAQRNMQIAADAAAVAAALNASYNTVNSSTPTSAANAAAALNGVAASYVTVNTPPQFGWHTGVGYYEVIISTPNPTIFMNIFGMHSINVAARSVAGIIPSPSCIYVLNNTTTGTSLYVKGGASGGDAIDASGCSIQVNSPSPNAICDQGSATISSPGIYVAGSGGQSTSGQCNKTPTGGAPVTSGGLAQPDPYNNFIGPTSASSTPPCTMDTTTSSIGSAASYASPGAGNAVCFTNAISLGDKNGTLQLGSGTYVFLNGVTMNGSVQVTNGTLDVEQGQWTQNNYTLGIIAPTSGIYNSLAFMVPSTNTITTCGNSGNSVGITFPPTCVQLQFGSGGSGTGSCPAPSSTVTNTPGTLDGIIYAPTSTVWLQDSGGGVQATGVVAWNLYDNSQICITSYNQQNPSTTPLKTISMVE